MPPSYGTGGRDCYLYSLRGGVLSRDPKKTKTLPEGLYNPEDQGAYPQKCPSEGPIRQLGTSRALACCCFRVFISNRTYSIARCECSIVASIVGLQTRLTQNF